MEVIDPTDLGNKIAPLDYIKDCLDLHERQTGNVPCEIFLDPQFIMVFGARLNFHQLPFVLTFDGEKAVQHLSLERYWALKKEAEPKIESDFPGLE